MKLIVVTLLFLLVRPNDAMAYIPRVATIIKKMSNNSGHREYKIVREVTLLSKDQSHRVREVWTVAHGDRMKLEVSSLDESNPWKFAILYSKSNRKTMTQNKAVKTYKKSPDFVEPLFHDRYYKSLMKRLIGFKFIPEWVLRSEAPSYDDGQTKIVPEPFIQLAPMEGSVNYAIGARSNSQGGNNQTRLWVEQDSFVIKKGRVSSGAEFVNSDFQSYIGGLKLPNEQQISWGDRVAKIKMLAAERVTTGKTFWQLSKEDSGQIPSAPLIKEFYSRFR